MKRFTVAAFASAIVLTFAVDAHSAPMNLLTNPGFETGDFTGWTVGGNSVAASVETDGTPIPGVYVNFDPTVQNVRNGNYAGSALVALGASSASTAIAEVLTLTQTVNVLAGESYIISFFLGVDSPFPGFGVRVMGDTRLQIFANGLELLADTDFSLLSGSDPSDFMEVSAIYNSPATESIDVTFQITGSGTGRAGFSFDDFQVFGEASAPAVPEPTSMALFGVTALGMGVGVRRRGGSESSSRGRS